MANAQMVKVRRVTLELENGTTFTADGGGLERLDIRPDSSVPGGRLVEFVVRVPPVVPWNENMHAAPRDGRVLRLRLADGAECLGFYSTRPGSQGYWAAPEGSAWSGLPLIPRPIAWRAQQ